MIETEKVIVASVSAMVGIFSTQALTDRGKTGFYVAGKAGTSVVTQTDQRFRQDLGDDVYKYKNGNRNNTVSGAGPAVGYDFYQYYNVSVRTEMEFYDRGVVDSHYTLDTWYSPMGDGGREDTRNRLSVNTLIVSMYYDFKDSSTFTPWVPVRPGYTRTHHKATYIDTSWNKSGEVSDISALHYSGYDNSLAWSIGASVRYDMTPGIALDLSYHCLNAGKSPLSYKDTGGDERKSEAGVKSHDIMSGVTYNFRRRYS